MKRVVVWWTVWAAVMVGGPLGAKAEPETVDVAWVFQRASKLLQYNGLTRAIPHLERVLAHDPDYRDEVPFLLGQLYEYKKRPARASALFHMYLEVGHDEARKEQAREAITRLVEKGWRELVVEFEGEDVAGDVRIFDHVLIARARKRVAIRLPQGDYELRLSARDHDPARLQVAHGGDGAPEVISASLERQLFHGGVNVEVDQGAEAVVTITQERARARRGVMREPVVLRGPELAVATLPTGVYLIEVRAPGFERWVRRVQVERQLDRRVSARLTRELPPEIQDVEASLAQRHSASTRAARARVHGSAKIGRLRSERGPEVAGY